MLLLTPRRARAARRSLRRTEAARTITSRTITASAVAALVAALVAPVSAAPTQAASPVGQGFTVTPSDLSFILKQIKIAETHVASTTSATGPCGALLGNGANQLSSPLLMFGLRTVDGSCNNLQAGRSEFGAADTRFPRHATPVFKPADDSNVPGIGPVGPPGLTSYAQKSGAVVDAQPRLASNLIVDQTSTNPAAVAAAGFPVRTQHDPDRRPAVPCTTDPDPLAVPPVAAVPADCTPSHQTLFIPNVTTDVGLSPPYNSLFTLFGQFFDHGLDSVSKSGGSVFVPLPSDDPLIAGPNHQLGDADDLPADKRFMVLTRAANGPGPDGAVGTADDEQNGINRDTSFVDQSQTYTSHASHQVFLREYTDNPDGRPVSTGRLLGSADGGMATWALVKQQARERLGLQLSDKDVLNIPMIAADPYGKLIPGPARGLPQYITAGGLVEGDRAADGGKGVPVPADVRRIDTAFLDDIAHNASPKGSVTPDPDSTVGEPTAAQPAGTYDDELLDTHFTAGDGRTNENIGLTAIHQVFHSEHDRLVADIKHVLTTDTSATGTAALAQWKLATGAGGWNGERLFQAARFITEMQYQHLVFEEFARKVQPAIEPFTVYHDNVNPAIRAEFAHAVYRFGHSMLTDTISRTNVQDGSANDIGLLEGFLNPPAYTQRVPGGPSGVLTSEQAAGSIIMGMSGQVGNELDEFVTDTLRNNLLGLPLDLPTLNMARARDTGVPSLNAFRRQLHAATNDSQLQPYTDWTDFGLSIKHPESLVNFVAAYGTHPSITGTATARRTAAALLVSPPVGTDPADIPADAADFMNGTGAWANTSAGTRTGLDDVDLWMGGLAERTNLFGGLLGSTFNYVFENQMTDLQNGDRFYYLGRTAGLNLRTQLEGNSFAEMMMRNTDAHSLKADSFATSDCVFQLGHLSGTGSTVADDPTSDCDESKLLIRMADGTIRYRTSNSVDPPGINGQSVYNGTSGADRVRGGIDNDTFLGNDGNDRIEGDDGADVAIGGDGNDIITDIAGDDVPKGGPGNDAIDAGPGLDIVMGGTGKDFTNGGANANETFGGGGDDMIIAGGGTDTVFGDSGSDWIQGGDGQDLLCGDSCAPFFDDPNQPGNDVLIGQNGEEDYDAEGGDDIMIADAGIERNAGAGGYDWVTHERDTLPADADLTRPVAGVPLPANVLRDRYQETEALSGGPLADKLVGDSIVPLNVNVGVGGGFTGCDVLDQSGIDRVSGLGAILPTPSSPLGPVETASATGSCPLSGPVWGDGNIILGGAGSDLLEGRGADDVLDGDRYLHVRLSVRTDPADASTEIGSTDLMENPYKAGDPTTLQQAVFAGTVDPGNIVIVRQILANPGASDVDTAWFSGARASYTVTTTGGVTTVVDTRAGSPDGTDTLRNTERLHFSDIEIATPGEVVPAAPGAPTAVTAAAGNGSATVSFTPPGDPGSSPITSFQVVAETGGTVAATVTGVAPTATTAVVPGLTNGTAYTFRVRAVNAVGASPLSAASAPVTPTTGATAPGAPVIGVAQAGGNGGAITARAAWTPPASNGGSAITGYRVRALRMSAAGAVLATTTSAVQPAAARRLVMTLPVTGNYRFTVEAINAIGTGPQSARSNLVAGR
jgi:Ca2+-binding RTX toxin-like protein